MENRYRIIVLGAGFSRPAGFPIATELWQDILQSSEHLVGRAAKFNDDLSGYIDYVRACNGVELNREDVNFEEFMRFLDIEHFLSLRGSDTWSDEGNEGTIVTKTLIGAILANCSEQLNQIPELYLEFARRLQPLDMIITFNYDTLLERALDTIQKPYRLFPIRFKSVDEHRGIVGDEKGEVIILKMHGSIDWFDRKNFERQESRHQKLGAPPPQHVIFSHEKELGVRSVVDGPRFKNDPLRTVYRVGNLAALYEKTIIFLATPRMLSPSSAKIVYANQIGNFWDGMGFAGITNHGMAIIGFSLPPQDEYVRQIIYSLVTNYQNVASGESVLGKSKPPLTLVNYFSNKDGEKEFQKHYRFVDWNRTILHGGGFDHSTLDSIFQ